MKSELLVGVKEGLGEKVSAADPDWMVNGKWAVMQFCVCE